MIQQKVEFSRIVHSANTVFMCFVFISEKSSYFCLIQHKMFGFYDRDEKCLLRGTNWVFIYNSLCFVFKDLKAFHCDK